VALRAELDALPISEETGAPWAATNGAMHACGHDVHLAALFCAISVIRDTLPQLPVVALLQPREEMYPCGAVDLLAANEWKQANIGAVIGAHLQPRMPQGRVSVTPGAVNAASDEFEVVVHGVGGHAAYPHTVNDAVLAAAAIITALQQVVARRTDPMQPAVLSIGSVHGGDAANVIPVTVRILGVIRTFSSNHREQVENDVRSIAINIAAGHGCSARFNITRGEPVLINDPNLVDLMRPLVQAGAFELGDDHRSCGADDFAYYSDVLPAVMAFVGTGDASQDSPGLHNPAFLPPDTAIEDVTRVLLAGFIAAERVLRPGTTHLVAEWSAM
jgi:amidohydrolase